METFYVNMVTMKTKTFSKFTKKQSGISIPPWKITNSQKQAEREEKGIMELQNNQKAINKMALVCC